MGTGKSSVGCQLAKERGWNFIDLDELIELKEQRRIVDIFAKDGEAYFRKIEKNILKQVSTQKKFVVACGGGVVLDKDNIKLMKKTGRMICLYASPEQILKRVSLNNDRPLLNVDKPQKRIELLLKMALSVVLTGTLRTNFNALGFGVGCVVTVYSIFFSLLYLYLIARA